MSRTKIDVHYFIDSVVRFFEPENAKDLVINMEALIHDKELRGRLASNARAFVDHYTWDKNEKGYLELLNRPVGRG